MPAIVDGVWGGADAAKSISISSSRTVNVSIKKLDVGGTVTVTYGTDGTAKALLHHVKADVKVPGNFETTVGRSKRSRSAGSATVKLGVVDDGTGSATIDPYTDISADSTDEEIRIKFTAPGTMDGGKVSLEIPGGWGAMQRNPSKLNYISVTGNSNVSLEEPVVGSSSNTAVASITKLAQGKTFTFVYGGGTNPANNGVEVPARIGKYNFIIRSDADNDTVYKAITTIKALEGDDKVLNPDKLGAVFDGAPGVLKVEVAATAADDGKGTATVDKTTVRAGDREKLTFIYTSAQAIQNGELRLTVPSGWDKPNLSDTATAGYTVVDGSGLGTANVPEGKRYVTVPLVSIVKDDEITIEYGASDEGKVQVPTAIDSNSPFVFAVRGTSEGQLLPLAAGPVNVKIERQASGKAKSAKVEITDDQDDLHAGQMGREITVTYTALAEMLQGGVRLTIPEDWLEPGADNITATPSTGGSADDPMFDGQKVIVEGVNLKAGGKITFVYTGDVQPKAGTPKFAVATNGGLDDDDFTDEFKDVEAPTPDSVELTVDVGYAEMGSGMAEIADSDKVVEPGATGQILTFTYTAIGEIAFPSEFRVRVPRTWSLPSEQITTPDNIGTYTVRHERDGLNLGSRIVQESAPVDTDMVARVSHATLHVQAGDKIIFEYQNATAPADPEVSVFKVLSGGQTNDAQVGEDIKVFVQSAGPSQLGLRSTGTVSADPGAAVLAVTVELQDDEGNPAAKVDDQAVALASDTEGTFAADMAEAGTPSINVIISAGETSKVVYYSDSAGGTTATITASATGLTPATPHPVRVSTGVVAITAGSVMVSPALAKAG